MPADFLEALGALSINFGALENSLSLGIWMLLGGASVVDQEKYQIITTQLSFKQLVWMFGNLYRQRFPGEAEKEVQEFTKRCFDAEQKRNTHIHSLWVGGPGDTATRLKLTARSEGLRLNIEHHKKEELINVANILAQLSDDAVRFVATKLFPDPLQPTPESQDT